MTEDPWTRASAVALGVAVVAGGLAFVVAAFRDQRSPGGRLLRQDLDRTTRVTAALRRRQDVDQRDRPVAQAVVDNTRGTLHLGALLLSLAVLMAFTALTRPDSTPRWMTVGTATIGLVAAATSVVVATRLRRGGARLGIRPHGR